MIQKEMRFIVKELIVFNTGINMIQMEILLHVMKTILITAMSVGFPNGQADLLLRSLIAVRCTIDMLS